MPNVDYDSSMKSFIAKLIKLRKSKCMTFQTGIQQQTATDSQRQESEALKFAVLSLSTGTETRRHYFSHLLRITSILPSESYRLIINIANVSQDK